MCSFFTVHVQAFSLLCPFLSLHELVQYWVSWNTHHWLQCFYLQPQSTSTPCSSVLLTSVCLALLSAAESRDSREERTEQRVPAWEEWCLHRRVYFLMNSSYVLNLEERNKLKSRSNRASIDTPIPRLVSILSIFGLIRLVRPTKNGGLQGTVTSV